MSSGQTILVVEDDDTWRTVLAETLEDEGYTVYAVANYRDGRQALEASRFDLVLLDLELDKSAPMLEGERLLKWLSLQHAGTPCIIVSGQGDVHIVRNAFKKYHVVDFVVKDKRFDLLSFVQAVRGAIAQGATLPEELTFPLPPSWREEASAGSADGAAAARRARLTGLLQILTERFDAGELRTLCFHLSVDYDDLSGEGRTNKARELVRYLDRRDRLDECVKTGQQLRPDAPWDGLP